MSKFKDFLRTEQKKRSDTPTPDNFDQLIRQWQLQVKELHDQIEDWLAEESAEGLLNILRGYPVTVEEPELPPWEVDILIVFFEELEIIHRPESRYSGDYEGSLIVETDTVHGRLVRRPEANEDSFNNWFIKQDDYRPLTEKNYKNFLKEIIIG